MTEQNDQQHDDIETYSTTHESDGTEKQPTSTTTPPPATDAAAPAAEETKADAPKPTNTPTSEDDDAPKPGETPQQTAARTRSRLQARIDKLTEARYTEKGRADRLEQEIAELRRQQATRSSDDTATPDADDESGARRRVDPNDPAADFTQPQPDPATFDKYEDYLDARDEWREQRAQHISDKQHRQRSERDAETARTQHVRKVVDDFRKRTPDYDAVMANAHEAAIPVPAMRAMEESDNGAAIAYHLVKNPAERQALFDMSPMAQVRRIGQLEARFERGASGPKPKPVTSAPDPIEPIGGAGTSAARSLEDMDTDDYVDEMNKREREARRRR